jgi:hypothetical protein
LSTASLIFQCLKSNTYFYALQIIFLEDHAIQKIRQLSLHVEVRGTESDGLSLQRSLPGLCQHWLIPAIDRALEDCAPASGHLSIERLEIDIGALSLENMEHDLAVMVSQALEKILREQAKLSSQFAISDIFGQIQHKTEPQAINEAFVYFLETGSLPWSFRLPAGSSLEQVILASWQAILSSSENFYVATETYMRVLASATVRRRLVRQFSPVLLADFLALLSPAGKRIMDEVIPLLHSSDEFPADTKHFEQLLWETVFARVAARKVMSSVELIDETWDALPRPAADHAALLNVLERFRPLMTHQASVTANRLNKMDTGALDRLKPGFPRHTKRGSSGQVEPGSSNFVEPGSPRHPSPLSPKLFESQNTSISVSQHPDAGEGLFIDNAGLVILHPFLPQFFAALGIAAEDKLLQPERALGLLHFLTTGQCIAPEYELVLPKILCNMPLGAPVDSDMALTAAEQAEAAALLQAVIRNWQALRNTSPDGLRGEFLLRPGKMSVRNDDWLLQVESRTCDILLEQLPWGIAMIKLPWMAKMLWVEWR